MYYLLRESHRKKWDLITSIKLFSPYVPSLVIYRSVQPMQQEDYESLKANGLHAVLDLPRNLQQESYAKHHIKGKKSNFDWRLATPDRLGKAGVHKIGLGCLFGLTKDWRTDAFCCHPLRIIYRENIGKPIFDVVPKTPSMCG